MLFLHYARKSLTTFKKKKFNKVFESGNCLFVVVVVFVVGGGSNFFFLHCVFYAYSQMEKYELLLALNIFL